MVKPIATMTTAAIQKMSISTNTTVTMPSSTRQWVTMAVMPCTPSRASSKKPDPMAPSPIIAVSQASPAGPLWKIPSAKPGIRSGKDRAAKAVTASITRSGPIPAWPTA